MLQNTPPPGTRLGAGDDVARDVSDARRSSCRARLRSAVRRETIATTLRDRERDEEARDRRADSPVGRMEPVDGVDPPGGPGREQPLVEGEARDPGGDQSRAPGRRVEDVLGACSAPPLRASPRGGPRRAARRPSRAGAGSSGSSRSRRRARRAVAIAVTSTMQELLRRARDGVLQRDRRGVGVRERLVRLGDEEREERDDRGEAASDDRGGQRGRVAEPAREHEHRARARAARRPGRSSRGPVPASAPRRVCEKRV